MLTRIMLVVKAGKLAGRLTRLLPDTAAPRLTHAEPFQPRYLEGGHAVEREGLVIRRVDRVGVVVLQRAKDDLVDGLLAVEDDLHPIREGVGGGAFPAAALAPAQAGAIAVGGCLAAIGNDNRLRNP